MATENTMLAALSAHYERNRGQKYEVKAIRGPDGKPMVVYFDPVTNAQAQAVRARAGSNATAARLSLYAVIYLAKNADGTRMFEDDAATVKTLTEAVDGNIVAQIADAIMSQSGVDDLGN